MVPSVGKKFAENDYEQLSLPLSLQQKRYKMRYTTKNFTKLENVSPGLRFLLASSKIMTATLCPLSLQYMCKQLNHSGIIPKSDIHSWIGLLGGSQTRLDLQSNVQLFCRVGDVAIFQ